MTVGGAGDAAPPPPTGVLFDLDGTLIDSVYQHVLAWRQALDECGIDLSVWRIHRRIGMSGGLFVSALLRETGIALDDDQVAKLGEIHGQTYLRLLSSVRPLPGARALLHRLDEIGVRWAIATSGRRASAGPAVRQILGLGEDEVTLVTRDDVRYAKPDPDLFVTAADRLGVDIRASVVVGDSVWDMLAARRAGCLGVGLLSGGYGAEELERAGAYQVYADPADLLLGLDELGIRA